MAHAQHGNLPSRTNTIKSSEGGYVSDEDAVPDAAPSDTTGVLLERLQAWKHCCAYLEDYVKTTEKMLKEHSKDYGKVMKSISAPLREGHHFDQATGGVAGLFENMRTNTQVCIAILIPFFQDLQLQAIANSYIEASKSLDGQVLPVLARLHKEIKNKHSELGSGAGKAAKAVDTAKNETQKRIELLGQHTASFDSAGGKLDAPSDPYVVRRGVHHMLHKQILEENNSRRDLVSVQQNFESFEAHVIQTIQQAFGQFLQYTGGRADKEKLIYSDITNNAQSIAQDFEWQKFLHRSGDLMVNPNAPPKDAAHVVYPNMDHASTKPLIAGTLERKSRALTGYKAAFYVVTPTKYLHQFESDDDFSHDPSPELSLYLPDCTIGAVSDTKFNVKGKDVSKGKLGNKLQMAHELSFKASSLAEAQKWHGIIASAASGTIEQPLQSPVSPSAGDKLPEIETQNLPTTGKEDILRTEVNLML